MISKQLQGKTSLYRVHFALLEVIEETQEKGTDYERKKIIIIMITIAKGNRFPQRFELLNQQRGE